MKSCCSASRENFDDTKIHTDQHVFKTHITSEENMVYLDGGEFVMGTDDANGFPSDGEGPARKVAVSPFLIDKYVVTNEAFAKFINDTGYVTEAEQFGWSFVFYSFLTDEFLKSNPRTAQQTPWWVAVKGAIWKYPEGPGSGIEDRMDHPVVHVSWNDAKAFCEWSGKRLPTEAEWEYAARGGLDGKIYPWGDELIVDGKHQCNIWQGEFPTKNTKRNGYFGTCPVDNYEPNGYGLYNTAGNVWEWCEDWFDRNYHSNSVSDNPTGPATGQSKSIRGGSYLCHKSYCNRYRVAARSANTPDSSTGNTGFRCVIDV
ncbi:formylglycine-generating enzyme family protein [Virgibacillus ndiopensis]|uniref:formylglycine-generating enzyme family protein n=1 Tax=Virgibacillus ndiopensis TaxID=2004408 RepID=UPI000C089CB3|nr:formylglycine-generating enzyme family protein [Virgibacillus ndiopensis]